jgi:hypothetical protein
MIRVYIIIKPISLLVNFFLVLSEGVITRLSPRTDFPMEQITSEISCTNTNKTVQPPCLLT